MRCAARWRDYRSLVQLFGCARGRVDIRPRSRSNLLVILFYDFFRYIAQPEICYLFGNSGSGEPSEINGFGGFRNITVRERARGWLPAGGPTQILSNTSVLETGLEIYAL